MWVCSQVSAGSSYETGWGAPVEQLRVHNRVRLLVKQQRADGAGASVHTTRHRLLPPHLEPARAREALALGVGLGFAEQLQVVLLRPTAACKSSRNFKFCLSLVFC